MITNEQIVQASQKTAEEENHLKNVVRTVKDAREKGEIIHIGHGTWINDVLRDIVNELNSPLLAEVIKRHEQKVLNAKHAEYKLMAQRMKELSGDLEEVAVKKRRYAYVEKVRSRPVDIPDFIGDDDIEEFLINNSNTPTDVEERLIYEVEDE